VQEVSKAHALEFGRVSIRNNFSGDEEGLQANYEPYHMPSWHGSMDLLHWVADYLVHS
jgi:hypothetical protein